VRVQVEEVDVADKYNASVSGSVEEGFFIENTYEAFLGETAAEFDPPVTKTITFPENIDPEWLDSLRIHIQNSGH